MRSRATVPNVGLGRYSAWSTPVAFSNHSGFSTATGTLINVSFQLWQFAGQLALGTAHDGPADGHWLCKNSSR